MDKKNLIKKIRGDDEEDEVTASVGRVGSGSAIYSGLRKAKVK